MDIEQMQEEINQCRERHNREHPLTGEPRSQTLGPRDKDYLPPVTEFVTIKFCNGG